MKHLPMTRHEMKKLGWKEVDIILVTGDAYVDHPSFGVAVIARVLQSEGFRVGVISQPDWRSLDDITALGRPRLFFGVTAGNVDSMVANYTASKKRRRSDDYTPGGLGGKRPDRATLVYSNLIKRAFGGARIVLGGIEASLRRFAHYDWWSNRVRKSVLVDAKADVIAYGMAEKSIIKIARSIAEKGEIGSEIPGIVFWSSNKPDKGIEIPSYDEISIDKLAYVKAFRTIYDETDPIRGTKIYQKQDTRYVIQNPLELISSEELDRIYSLPYTREVHPESIKLGKVKAIETVKFSITTHRGCYGECNFCAITLHQGRYVISRSSDSILSEAKLISQRKDFKGTITDVGGPSANMYGFECSIKFEKGACHEKRCLFPKVCPALRVNHDPYIRLLRQIRKLERVKHVFISSGIRYDLILADRKNGMKFLNELIEHHISGQLKIAPEHISEDVLALMGKPGKEVLDRFISLFKATKGNRKLYLVGYFIAAHPGCKLKHMEELRSYVKSKMGYTPRQIQIFTPTPMTFSTTMFYTEMDPFSAKKIFVEKSEKKRTLQKEMLLRKPQKR
ncbi:hypothetical protein AT15_02935 [Kosmotoga arenicorallina S304]|uniref:Radical SAM core domain-containing protein n=1 Tax=Kosmotoga arenicorallina S304 TaxID=1453497 RepID=A0A182C7W5_9BACT|nr:YgiQ family radical SAM protein [Kosmotoga arenicorallina]OAA31799.1 hypothetical protein AT15_02935 [Kosmotoga arenicorallina S304]